LSGFPPGLKARRRAGTAPHSWFFRR